MRGTSRSLDPCENERFVGGAELENEDAEVDAEDPDANVADEAEVEVEEVDEKLPPCGELLRARVVCGRMTLPREDRDKRFRLWFVNEEGGGEGECAAGRNGVFEPDEVTEPTRR